MSADRFWFSGRHELFGFTVAGIGRLRIPELSESVSLAAMNIGIERLQLGGFAVRGDRLLELSFLSQSVSEGLVNVEGLFGIQFQGLLITADRSIQVSLFAPILLIIMLTLPSLERYNEHGHV